MRSKVLIELVESTVDSITLLPKTEGLPKTVAALLQENYH
jgi:hypothetical protein